jgi:hypothetical protein
LSFYPCKYGGLQTIRRWAWPRVKECHKRLKLSESVSTRVDHESVQLCSQHAGERARMKWHNRAHQVPNEKRERSPPKQRHPASAGPADSGQGLVTGEDIIEFLVVRFWRMRCNLRLNSFKTTPLLISARCIAARRLRLRTHSRLSRCSSGYTRFGFIVRPRRPQQGHSDAMRCKHTFKKSISTAWRPILRSSSALWPSDQRSCP